MNNKSNQAGIEVSEKRVPLLAQFSGTLLLTATLFVLAAIVAFGSLGQKSAWGWSFGVLGLLSLCGWFLGRRLAAKSERIAGDGYSRKRTVLGVNALVSMVLFVALLVGLNYIAARRHKVFDLTKTRVNSLSDQTHKALDGLKSPITMTYIWAPSPEMPQIDATAQSLLESYRGASDKVKLEYFNAAQDDLRLQAMKLNTFSGQPMLLIEALPGAEKGASTARQEVAVMDEQNVTSGILKLNDSKPRALYFLSGHGEMSPLPQQFLSAANNGMNGARAALEAQNYALKNLSLMGAQTGVPRDAQAVVVVAPQVDISGAEEQKLRKYIAGDGRLVLLFQIPRAPLPHWKRVLTAMNIAMLDGQVLEFDRERAVSPQVPIGTAEPAQHALLRGVSGAVVLPGVLPLQVKPAPPGAAGAPLVTPLFLSSVQSEVVQMQNGQLQRGTAGPFVMAAAVEKNAGAAGLGGMRSVVAGNAAFCTDRAFNQFGNTSFFLSVVNWVAGNDALVSIPPKEPVTNSINMTGAVQRFAVLFSLFTLPVLLLLVGTVIWWKRR